MVVFPILTALNTGVLKIPVSAVLGFPENSPQIIYAGGATVSVLQVENGTVTSNAEKCDMEYSAADAFTRSVVQQDHLYQFASVSHSPDCRL